MNKQTVVRALAAVIVAGGFWVGLTQQPDRSLEAEQIRPAAHAILGGGGNVGVFVTEEGVVLVDDKFERHVPEILEKVKAITDQPVRYVFNTHHHGDHVGGNPTLLESTEIIAHRNARENMLKNSQAGLPRVTFREQTSVFLGGQEIRAYYFGRGHTDGDAVIHYPDQKVIHSGDLFIRASPFIDYSSGGSALEWDKTLTAILQLDFDTVIPGHGPVAKREDLVRWKKDFQTLRSRVRQLRRQGKTAEQIEKLVKLDDLQGWSMTNLLQMSLPGLYDELSAD